jgi:hypothetical protein
MASDWEWAEGVSNIAIKSLLKSLKEDGFLEEKEAQFLIEHYQCICTKEGLTDTDIKSDRRNIRILRKKSISEMDRALFSDIGPGPSHEDRLKALEQKVEKLIPRPQTTIELE